MPVQSQALRAFLACAAVLTLIFFTAPVAAQQQPHGPTLAGQLLVATPDLRDPNFEHTVVFMVSHDENGAMGIVLNRPVAVGPISEVLSIFGMKAPPDAGDIRLYAGGPVQRSAGFILHSTDYLSEDTLVVNEDVALTAHTDILLAIARGEGPTERLVAFGYAGWGPGQLEGELDANAWLTVEAPTKFIFDTDLETKWRRAIEMRGRDL